MQPQTRPFRTLVLVLLAALAVRVAWTVVRAPVLENEGAEYARLAENLLHGRGYIGLTEQGPQLNFPPLYPVLIAGGTLVLGSSAAAAHVVSLAAGLLMIAALFLIVRRLYGSRAALLSAGLAACHPMLIALSSSGYSEGLALGLNLWGVSLVLDTCDGTSRRAPWLAGVAFGLAYLTRPEAFVYVGALGAALVLCGLLARRGLEGLRPALVMGLAFALVASPYIAFLTHATGRLRLEGKGSINYAIGERMLAGQSYLQAGYEVTDDLRETGVHLRPNLDVLRESRLQPGGMLRYMVGAARSNLKELVHVVLDMPAMGSPALAALALLGLLGAAWSAERWRGELVLAAFGGAVLAVLLTIQRFDVRNFFPLLALLIIWAGRGLEHAGSWLADSTGALGLARYRRPLFASGAAAALALVVALSARGLADVGEFTQARDVPLKQAGLWIRDNAPAGGAVMDIGTVPAYYAGRRLRWMPFASSSTTLRYIAASPPAFIIVRADHGSARPFLPEWIAGGIPGDRAQLVREFGSGEHVVRVYKYAQATDSSAVGQ